MDPCGSHRLILWQPFKPVQDQHNPPFEGFSDRVTDGTDQERTVAYSRWLKRLRDNQEQPETADTSSEETASR